MGRNILSREEVEDGKLMSKMIKVLITFGSLIHEPQSRTVNQEKGKEVEDKETT